MGDRGNIVMLYPSRRGENKRVATCFYTHWGGSALPHTLSESLGRRLRWDDDSYLARIIFCGMIAGDTDSETGFGISPRPPDNEHKFIVVDTVNRRVAFRGGGFMDPTPWSAVIKPVGADGWAFDEYVTLTEAELDSAFGNV